MSPSDRFLALHVHGMYRRQFWTRLLRVMNKATFETVVMQMQQRKSALHVGFAPGGVDKRRVLE